jgi:hypothetical protein
MYFIRFSIIFTHPSISPDIAVPLGVNTKREQKVKECSKPLKLYSKEFGQNEELITRIKRILSGYPCDTLSPLVRKDGTSVI